MFDLFITGLKCAFRNKIRTILTITGITVGVASVVLVSTIGNVGTSAINQEMTGMGMDSLVISASELNEECLNVVNNIENVSKAMPLINKITYTTICGKKYDSMVWGVNENANKVIDLEVKCGRLINRGDISNKQMVCVIDEALAIKSFGRENIVGKHINVIINGTEQEFEVIGVVKNGVNILQNMLGGFIPDFIYIPYTVMQEETNSYTFDNITVRLDQPDKSNETAKMIEKKLLAVTETINVENLLKQKDKMNNIMNIASAALSVVAGISMIVSGISIMTVMLVAVSERTREIGIKKSIGATTLNIMSEFLVESVIITFLGGISGIIFGTLLSLILSVITNVKFVFNIKLSLLMLIISIAVGIIFGVYPAKKAAQLNPADALRQE